MVRLLLASKLLDVAVWVFRAELVERAHVRPLEHRPERLHAVDVDLGASTGEQNGVGSEHLGEEPGCPALREVGSTEVTVGDHQWCSSVDVSMQIYHSVKRTTQQKGRSEIGLSGWMNLCPHRLEMAVEICSNHPHGGVRGEQLED